MKKAVSIALALLCLSFVSCGRGGAASSQTEAMTDGVVYEYYGEGTEIIKSATTYKDGKEAEVDKYDYWPDGNLKTITTYKNGAVDVVTGYTYKDGRLYQSLREFTDGTVKCQEMTTHNESGSPAQIDFYEDGTKTGSYRYSYNGEDKAVLEERLDADGGVLSYVEYDYDEAGRELEARLYEFGDLTKYWQYSYDEGGKSSQVITYNSRGEKTLITNNTLDENGNIVGFETEIPE